MKEHINAVSASLFYSFLPLQESARLLILLQNTCWRTSGSLFLSLCNALSPNGKGERHARGPAVALPKPRSARLRACGEAPWDKVEGSPGDKQLGVPPPWVWKPRMHTGPRWPERKLCLSLKTFFNGNSNIFT